MAQKPNPAIKATGKSINPACQKNVGFRDGWTGRIGFITRQVNRFGKRNCHGFVKSMRGGGIE
jgi:hypothetical protein